MGDGVELWGCKPCTVDYVNFRELTFWYSRSQRCMTPRYFSGAGCLHVRVWLDSDAHELLMLSAMLMAMVKGRKADGMGLGLVRTVIWHYASSPLWFGLKPVLLACMSVCSCLLVFIKLVIARDLDALFAGEELLNGWTTFQIPKSDLKPVSQTSILLACQCLLELVATRLHVSARSLWFQIEHRWTTCGWWSKCGQHCQPELSY